MKFSPYFGRCGTQQGGDTVSYRVRVSEDKRAHSVAVSAVKSVSVQQCEKH